MAVKDVMVCELVTSPKKAVPQAVSVGISDNLVFPLEQ